MLPVRGRSSVPNGYSPQFIRSPSQFFHFFRGLFFGSTPLRPFRPPGRSSDRFPPLFIIMSRRYVKRRPFAKRNKYSVEQTTYSLGPPTVTNENRDTLAAQTSIAIVPPTEVQGMRKVKNFTVSFAALGGSTDVSPDRSFYYALVYVPQGYQTGILRTPYLDNARTMYDANQFVLSCGIIDLSAGPQRIFTKLSRNLNSGDNIYMILKQVGFDQNAFNVCGVISYAITLQ